MTNRKHLEILRQGAEAWNKWRKENPGIIPDLSSANLDRADLSGADLSGANLMEAHLMGANLKFANLTDANLMSADLLAANLIGANLSGANISYASLVETRLKSAILKNCDVYGISAWDVDLDEAIQTNLVITPTWQPTITVDDLEVAQFIYLLLNNAKVRNVINTITSKSVLILGRFADETRKDILDAMRDKLREKGFVPIIFDFERAKSLDFTETVKVIAGMALFAIADITNPKSTPLELQGTVPDYMVPFIPIIQEGEAPFSMFVDLQKKYHWVMEVRTYTDKQHLIDHFESGILKPARELHQRLLIEKNETLKSKPIDEF